MLSWGPALLKLGWRSFNSKFPWYNRRSKKQSLLGTETARWDPSHGINKDCSKPEPVDWKLEALEYTTKITETHGNLTLWIHGNSFNVLELMFCRIRRVFLLSSLVSFRIPNSMRTWPANISLNTRWPYSLLCHHFKFWNQCRHYFHLWVTRTVSPKAWENVYSALEKSTGNLNLWINEARDRTMITGTHGNPTLWIRMEKITGNHNLWIL